MSDRSIEGQLKLFEPVFHGVVPAKDQQDLMTYPFFSLSKKKRIKPIKFDNGKVKITVTGQEEHGIANIYDADILIYVASQIMEAKNRNQATSRRIKISQYDILKFLGKGTGGDRYKRLQESLERLQSTSVQTTIKRENSRFKHKAMFSWIERWQAVVKNGIPIAIEFWVDEWFYEGILEGKILTLPHSYFRIEGGLERFLYKLCRKIIGSNHSGYVEMKLENVHKRSGLTRKPSEFLKMVQKISKNQSIPDYWIFVVNEERTDSKYLCAYSRLKFETEKAASANIAINYLQKTISSKGT